MVLRNRTRPRAYQLGARLAAGGMGEVYEAFTEDLHRRVAVKRMIEADGADDDLKLLFLREVAVAATLEHHNVVEVLDAGQNGHELFLVMEFVDGPSLAEIVEVLRRDGKILPIEITCGIVSQIAVGLGHAHERSLPDGSPLGIVHRDVAPENVLIGSEGIPKILDFGLAKLSGHSLTQPGVIRGRPRNLSPEQARGDAVDARSDIFALGTILFELAAGQSLYPNEPMASLLWKVAQGAYAPIEPRLTHVDAGLIEILHGMLAVDPARRFRSAREVERALAGFRAARGLRVSSRAVAQVVKLTWPAIQETRRQRLDGSSGELEGMRLILPADRLDPTGDLDFGPEISADIVVKRAEIVPIGAPQPGALADAPPVPRADPASLGDVLAPVSAAPVSPGLEAAAPSRAPATGSPRGPSTDPARARGAPRPPTDTTPPTSAAPTTGAPSSPAREAPGRGAWVMYALVVTLLAALAFLGAYRAGAPATAVSARRAP